MTQRAFYHGMGQAKLGMIDVRDIADCAAKALLDRSLAGKTFTPVERRASATRRLRRHSRRTRPGREGHSRAGPEAVADGTRKAGWGEWAAGVMRDCQAPPTAAAGETLSAMT